MWSFYSSLAVTENLGVTLAIAFAVSPIAGTVVGIIHGDQTLDFRTAIGMVAITVGIILIQLGRGSQH
jgi:drug/metabolite transporter (DMT)-like permease